MKFNKKNEKNYDFWQNVFDTHGTYMIAGEDNEYARIRKTLCSRIDDGDFVLDIGCASGNTLEVLESMRKGCKYKGTDYAGKFIKACKKRRPEIEWEVMDARYLKEEDNSFDVVIIYDVLDALEGWELAIDEALRVAKKKVLITMWMDAHMDEKLEYMKERCKDVEQFEMEGEGLHYHYFIIGEVK